MERLATAKTLEEFQRLFPFDSLDLWKKLSDDAIENYWNLLEEERAIISRQFYGLPSVPIYHGALAEPTREDYRLELYQEITEIEERKEEIKAELEKRGFELVIEDF